MTFLEKRALKKAKAKKKARRKAVFKAFASVLKVLGTVTGVLFIVYFWNLDQKLMEWAYRRVNTIFDRKKTDVRF